MKIIISVALALALAGCAATGPSAKSVRYPVTERAPVTPD